MTDIPEHLIDALGFGPPHDEREYDAIRRVLVALRSEDVHLVPAWASEHLKLLVECADLRAAYRAAVAESRSAREEAYKSQQERDEARAEAQRLKADNERLRALEKGASIEAERWRDKAATPRRDPILIRSSIHGTTMTDGAGVRDVVADFYCDLHDQGNDDPRAWADAVLAALREHWTSDEEVNRISKDFHAGWYALVIAALFEETDRG